jgi:hypothetical protein
MPTAPEGCRRHVASHCAADYHYAALIIPRLLGLLVFGWILLALHRARVNLIPARSGLVEAQEAIQLGDTLWYITVALAAVYLLVVCIHRAVRSYLAARSGTLGPPPLLLAEFEPLRNLVPPRIEGSKLAKVANKMRWVPVALTLFVAIAFACSIYEPHAASEMLPRVMMAPLLLGGVVFILGELAMLSHRYDTPILLVLVITSVALLLIVEGFHDVRTMPQQDRIASAAMGENRQISLAEGVKRWRQANDCTEESEKPCPRPILIAGAGGASRAAFLTATVVGTLIDLGNEAGRIRYGNVRNRIFALSTVSGSSLGAVVTRAALSDAIERGTPDQPPCQKQAQQLAWFRSIRGSDAVRSGLLREEANPALFWRDCLQLLLAGDFLSPVAVGIVYRDLFPMVDPWTRTAIWLDRAALLEQAFERRYHAITSDAAPQTCDDRDSVGLCRPFGWHPPYERAKAWVPLLFINGTSVSTGRRIVVSDVPMGDAYAGDREPEKVLLPFAYDFNDFRRMPLESSSILLASALPSSFSASAAPAAVSAPLGQPIDIRLSTAATMSARFPLISPHGNLRDRKGNLRDKVVDGGYFENDGLATLADLAWALRHHFQLDPVVIRIVNEPTKTDKEERLRKDRPPVPDDDERTPFDGVLSIFRTLTATRSGHEDGHEAYLKTVLGAEGTAERERVPGKDRLYEVRVYQLAPEDLNSSDPKQTTSPERNPFCRQYIPKPVSMASVSMNWWMSHPMQAYLDAQLCVRANWKRLDC